MTPEETKESLVDRSPQNNDTLGGQEVSWTPKAPEAQEVTPGKDSYIAHGPVLKEQAISEKAQTSWKEASSRETAFIKEFLADTPASIKSDEKSSDWRVTALDRRVAKGVVSVAKRKNNLTDSSTQDAVAIKSSITGQTTPGERFWPAMSNRGQSPLDKLAPLPIPSSQATDSDGHASVLNAEASDISRAFASLSETSNSVQSASTIRREEDNVQLDNWIPHGVRQIRPKPPAPEQSSAQAEKETRNTTSVDNIVPKSSRSTSDILRQLPENDLDFLSAEEIRASMGVRKSKIPSTEEKQGNRGLLEKGFKNVHEKEPQLDPVLGANIVNDQLMRRTVRELDEEQRPKATPLEEKAEETQAGPRPGQSVEVSSSSQPAIETSIDRMTRRLQAGGDAFAKLFWSEPIQDKPGPPSEHRYKAIISGLKAGRNAIEYVDESLRRDFPATGPLLARLKENENNVVRSVEHLLFQSENKRAVPGQFKHSIRAIRTDLKKTEAEFEEACKALEAMKSDDAKFLSENMKSRLRTASVVLQKNAKLTRRFIFNVQALWENPSASSYGLFFREIENRLSALQDTQLALVRLIERSMQIFGVSAKASEAYTTLERSELEETYACSEQATPDSILNALAEHKLKEEIQAQKSAMRGLSDDGYTRPPKSSKKPSFEDPSPLAHSLFRPFGPIFDSLGKDPETIVERPENQAVKDRALVREIRKSYEDVYGPISVDHRQVKENETEAVEPALKEDIQPTSAEEVESTVVDVKAAELCTEPSEQAKDDLSAKTSVTPTPLSFETPASVEGTDASHQKDIATHARDDGAYNPGTNPISDPVLEQQTSLSTGNSSSTLAEDHPIPFTETESSTSASIPERSFASELASNENTETPTEETMLKEYTYRILAYDPSTEEIHITTTADTSSQSALAPTIPLHEALAAVSDPAKFLSHLSSSSHSEIITAKPNLIVLREPYIPGVDETQISPPNHNAEVREEEWKPRNPINPIDGTTRLSPTGFVGVEPDLRDEELRGQQRQEWYEKWKRENAGMGGLGERTKKDRERWKDDGEGERRKRRGGAASVFKTAIVASAGCYAIGVIGELMK